MDEELYSTVLDEYLERNFMQENFPDLVELITYDESLTDTVQLFAR